MPAGVQQCGGGVGSGGGGGGVGPGGGGGASAGDADGAPGAQPQLADRGYDDCSWLLLPPTI